MSRKKKKLAIYIALLCSAFLLLFAQPRLFTSLKFFVINATTLPVRIISIPIKEFKKILFYHRTFDEYVRLRKEVSTLKARITGFEEVLKENTRLEKMLQFKRKLIYSSVAANVVGRDPSNWNSTIVIDKGSDDGMAQGMPVVNAQGVVGKIFEVDQKSSKVILVSDPSFSVVALEARTREVGLVAGTLHGMCRMKYLSQDADVKVGDQVITSKLSSTFPEGLVIGEVINVYKREESPVTECLVRPAVPLSQIEEVLVIQTTD